MNICNVTNGSITSCTPDADPDFDFSYTGLALNNNFLYSTSADNNITYCPISNGTIGACDTLNDSTFNGPQERIGFNVTHAGTFAFIANYNNNSISSCPVLSDGTFGTCTPLSDVSFNSPLGLVLNPAGTVLYVANSNDILSVCPVLTNGILGTCTPEGDASFDFNEELVNFFSTSENLYIPNCGSNTVSICQLNGNGMFLNCTSIQNIRTPFFWTFFWTPTNFPLTLFLISPIILIPPESK